MVNLICNAYLRPKLFFALIFFIAGCAPIEFQIAPPTIKPLIEKRNAVIKVEYDNSILEHACTSYLNQFSNNTTQTGPEWIFNLGQPTVHTLDSLWGNIFTDFTIINHSQNNNVTDPHIKVYLDYFSLCEGVQIDDSVIRLLFQFQNGGLTNPIVLLVEGRASREGYNYSFLKDLLENKRLGEQYLEHVTKRMLRNLVANFVIEIESNQQLSTWPKSSEAANDSLDQ